MGKGYDYRGGTDFIGALLRTAGRKDDKLKIRYGNRHGLWYVIDKEDRDFDCPWALTYTDARDLGEKAAYELNTGASFV